MASILDALASLQKTPVPALLVVAGILLLLLGFVEQIGAIVRLPAARRTSAMVTGVLLLLSGVGLFIVPSLTTGPVQAQYAPVDARPPSDTGVSHVGLAVEPGGVHAIYRGTLSPGYDMGVNTSGGLTTWVHRDTSGICMVYPDDQDWGAVFVTVGRPRDPPRPSRDLSAFKRLALELRGANGGESVSIGIKSSSDPDDGSETKILVPGLTKTWTRHEWPLAKFSTADLRHIYVPVEFVFDGPGKTVCFRNVSYLP
jgi:hypothetical protein